MSKIDMQVAAILDTSHSDDEDALIASLDDSLSLDAFREQRIQQLHAELSRAKAQQNQGFGKYTEIKEEKFLIELTTEVKNAVIHFSKDEFGRCRVMDGHLEELAKRHLDTRFLKIDVENAPFLVRKLKVQVLPCILAFIDGVTVDRIVGFEGLVYMSDNFTTQDLEARLISSGVILRAKTTSSPCIRFCSKSAENYSIDDDDWD